MDVFGKESGQKEMFCVDCRQLFAGIQSVSDAVTVVISGILPIRSVWS